MTIQDKSANSQPEKSQNEESKVSKLRLETADLTKEYVNKISELFPGVVTEGKVNFDLLRTFLGDNVTGDEAYEFTWVGKREAIREAARPIRKTLRPCIEESKNWDTTENLYIEGDNLDVLKLLQESYLGKVKMIYIDPPYNTGSDFVYRDNFTQSREDYESEAGVYNEEGDRLFRNTESNGRFHSDWCSMMYPRLLLARNLLKDEGLIFISIDDNEIENLKKICNEVFGESNFISVFVWQNKKGGGNDSLYVAIEHEYILAYARNKSMLKEFYESYSDSYSTRYKEKDDKGRFFWDTFKRKSGKQYYPIKCPDGTILEYDEDGNAISWLRSQPRFNEDIQAGEIRIVKINGKWSVQFKQRMPEGKKPRSIFTTETVLADKGTTSTGSNDVFEYFKKDVFSNPKPVALLRFLLGFGALNDDIILDFFSGSGTIAEAVFLANAAESNGKRKFIAVQINEDIDAMLASSSANAKRVAENAVDVLDELGKPHYITELAKERIRRAGAKIKEKSDVPKNDLDIGFRVLKLDDTNMKDVYYAAGEYTQDLLSGMESNIKEDRTDLDLLFGCLLDWGLPLSLPHTQEKIDGVTVHTYNGGDLIACFADNVSEKVVKEIAKRQPLRAVFRDSSFSNSPRKINVDEIFKLLAPKTTVKVL
jgi:adenine-specific DNA-methyltransferase